MPELLEAVIGPDGGDLTWWQMSLRAFFIFIAGTLIVRVGSTRFLGQSTAFDFLVVVIVGSVLSRAINGTSPFLKTLAGAATIVGAHWVVAQLAFRWHAIGVLFKGREHILVRDGVIDWKTMGHCQVTERDLQAALRIRAGTEDLAAIRLAQLERTGQISTITKDSEKP